MTRLPFVLAFLFLAVPIGAQAQTVTNTPNSSQPLEQRWDWAVTQARGSACSNGCWIGYSIVRLMDEDSYIGSWSDRDDRPTLEEVIYGRHTERLTGDGPRNAAQRAVERQNGREAPKVEKEVAFLFRAEPGDREIRDIQISNMSMSVDLDGLPVLWLGQAGLPESIAFVREQFGTAGSTELKKNLVTAAGIHEGEASASAFLRQVLSGQEDDEVRSQSAFWLAEQDGPEAASVLEQTAKQDRSEEVREQAVFGLSRIDSDDATERLIGLAKGGADDTETREKAIFWLGQKASQKAAETLGDIAQNDPNTEIQKKAIFAISQLPHDEGIPKLITIARTHRNAKVRQDAIFWLGQSGDARAVDVLVDIARGE